MRLNCISRATLACDSTFEFNFCVCVLVPINFRWCTLSAERTKCNDFIKYVNETAQSKGFDVTVDCVEGSSADHDDCITKIKNNEADLVTLKGAYVYKAGKMPVFPC